MPALSFLRLLRRAGQHLGLLGRGFAHPDPTDVVTPEERHNSRIFIWEAPFTNIAFGSVASFFALFAIQLGGSNAVVGWLTSGPAVVNMLWPLPSSRIIQRLGNYPRALALSAFFHRVPIIALAGIPFLPPAWRAWAIVVLTTLSALPATIWGASFQTASAEMFHPRHLARVVGERWAVMSIVGMVASLTLGKMLDLIPFPLNFQVLFAGLGILTLASVWFVLQLRMPPRQEEPDPPTHSVENAVAPAPWWQAYRQFARYEVGVFLAYFAMFAAVPLFRIYWVRELGATGTWIGVLTAAYSAGGLLGYIFWGRWNRPEREQRGMLIASLGILAGYPLLTTAFHHLIPLVPVMFFAGFMGGGNELIIFNRTVELSPRKTRPTFVAVHQMIANAAAFFAPLVSTALANTFGTRWVLMGSGAFGIIAAVLLSWLGWASRPSPRPAAPVLSP